MENTEQDYKPEISPNPIQKGKHVFEYDNFGNMINFFTIAHVLTKKPEFRAGHGGCMEFKSEVLEGGQVKRIPTGDYRRPGKTKTKYFIETAKTKNDFDLLRVKQYILNTVNKIEDVDFLNHLYAKAKEHLATGNKP